MESIISRETIRERGAAAYDQGRGVNDHRMNPGAAAIRDWQAGWHQRRVERSRAAGNQVAPASAETPAGYATGGIFEGGLHLIGESPAGWTLAAATVSTSGQTLYETWVKQGKHVRAPKWDKLPASTQIHWNKQAIYGCAASPAREAAHG